MLLISILNYNLNVGVVPVYHDFVTFSNLLQELTSKKTIICGDFHLNLLDSQ